MPTCRKCHTNFANHVCIDGKQYNLQRRKFCLSCSPLGGHNCNPMTPTVPRTRNCTDCGTTDNTKFYKGRCSTCRACQSKRVRATMQKRLKFARALLGDKCCACGYTAYSSALSIHHLDPNMKDKQFRCHRSWSEDRLRRELTNCVLLCMNCHTAVHSHELVLPEGIEPPLPH